MPETAYLRCVHPDCSGQRGLTETDFRCPICSGLMDVNYDWSRLRLPGSLRDFEGKWSRRRDPLCFSGVWRFHELLPFAPPEMAVTIGEGQTLLQQAEKVAEWVDHKPGQLFLQYEGMNPSGSFKDNGMCAAFTHARMVGAKTAACASTGNTSSSLAVYCSATNLMKAVVFVGSGKISYGKLAQALDHGALTLQIAGDFDDAMAQVQKVSRELGIYLVNSINPFRLEGQKTVMLRVLEALGWDVPDWIVLPGGNLGNTAAFGRMFQQLKELELIDRVPRFAVIVAAGSDTFFRLVEGERLCWNRGRPDRTIQERFFQTMDAQNRRASTIASAIEINRPVNLDKALRTLEFCGGFVRTVTDQEIMDAKAQVGAAGFGCEPASAASVAGLKKLRSENTINRNERVVCILTGHQLKDPTATVAYHGRDRKTFDEVLGNRGIMDAVFANRPVPVPNSLNEIVAAIKSRVVEPR